MCRLLQGLFETVILANFAIGNVLRLSCDLFAFNMLARFDCSFRYCCNFFFVRGRINVHFSFAFRELMKALKGSSQDHLCRSIKTLQCYLLGLLHFQVLAGKHWDSCSSFCTTTGSLLVTKCPRVIQVQFTQ